jgi:hypothetical protein
MASFILNWTPAGGLNSTGQQVQYKLSTSSTWITAATLGSSANTYTISSLLDNTIYDFQIVNLCTYGGPTTGSTFQTIKLTCPTVTATPTYNSVSFGFPDLGASVTDYRVDLLNAAGSSIIAFKNFTSLGTSISDNFMGLSPTTGYNLRVTVKAGSYTNVCALVPFTTDPTPTCNAPSSLTVTIS